MVCRQNLTFESGLILPLISRYFEVANNGLLFDLRNPLTLALSPQGRGEGMKSMTRDNLLVAQSLTT